MQAYALTFAVVLTLVAPGLAAHTLPEADDLRAQGDDERSAVAAGLVGSWRSEPYQLKLTGELERSVWGADASSVRTAELVVQASGQATLTITRGVLDAKGEMVPASRSIERAELTIGGVRSSTGTRTEHAVTVVNAERLYPDDPDYRWPLDGLLVRVMTFADSEAIEIRFEPREGRGSFWETLRRESRTTTHRASR